MATYGTTIVNLRHPPEPTTTPASYLASLPAELLLEIASHLPTSALIALKLVSKELSSLLHHTPTPQIQSASRCELLTTWRVLGEREEMRYGNRKCIICRLTMSSTLFPFDAPICHWHKAWFVATRPPRYLEASMQASFIDMAGHLKDTAWVPLKRWYCAHTKDIVGWHVPRCACACESCGHFEVMCYVKVSNGSGAQDGDDRMADELSSLRVDSPPRELSKSKL